MTSRCVTVATQSVTISLYSKMGMIILHVVRVLGSVQQGQVCEAFKAVTGTHQLR